MASRLYRNSHTLKCRRFEQITRGRALYYYLCREYLVQHNYVSVGHILSNIIMSLLDISCVLLLFLSDISSSVGHMLRFVVIFVGQI